MNKVDHKCASTVLFSLLPFFLPLFYAVSIMTAYYRALQDREVLFEKDRAENNFKVH